MKGLESKKGIMLDVGCGACKRPGFVGMDMRKLPGVDIVHNLEKFPWPLPNESCTTLVGSHIIEHIKPWFTIPFFNEVWRVLKFDGMAAFSTPYAGSSFYWQDPTHCNGFTERTFWYFDPSHPSGLWEIYKPKPFSIEKGFPIYQVSGALEVVLKKIKYGRSKCLKKKS